MSPPTRQTESGIHSLQATRGSSSWKSRTQSYRRNPEKDLERKSSSNSSLSHDFFQRELPFTIERWLADTENSRLTQRLVDSDEESPDELCAPSREDKETAAAIAGLLSKQSTYGADTTLPSTAGRTGDAYEESSLYEIGAWCIEDKPRGELNHECTCQATQDLSAIAKLLRSSLEELRYVSVRIHNALNDIEATQESTPE